VSSGTVSKGDVETCVLRILEAARRLPMANLESGYDRAATACTPLEFVASYLICGSEKVFSLQVTPSGG
jgi:hypothetical protein